MLHFQETITFNKQEMIDRYTYIYMHSHVCITMYIYITIYIYSCTHISCMQLLNLQNAIIFINFLVSFSSCSIIYSVMLHKLFSNSSIMISFQFLVLIQLSSFSYYRLSFHFLLMLKITLQYIFLF